MKGLTPLGSKTAHVAIVLDRSGSMEECREATIGGFNEFVEGIHETAERDELTVKVTLTVFNDEAAVRYIDAPISRLTKLSSRSYVPNGMTAMLDAVGETIERLRSSPHNEEDGFLVCVISDGYENASTTYTYSDIAERIQRLTATEHWTFTYLGSNQDLSQISQALHIPQGNVAAYQATPDGTNAAWRRHRARSARHLSSFAGTAPAPASFYEEENGTQ